MQNLVFTQLSIPELRKLIREEQTEATREILKDLITLKMKQPEPIRYLTKKEAMDIANIPITTLNTWIRCERLNTYKFGSNIRIKLSDLLEYLEDQVI